MGTDTPTEAQHTVCTLIYRIRTINKRRKPAADEGLCQSFWASNRIDVLSIKLNSMEAVGKTYNIERYVTAQNPPKLWPMILHLRWSSG
jgi:hypothetical protein